MYDTIRGVTHPQGSPLPQLDIDPGPGGVMGSFSVRMPAAFVQWLDVKAAENQSSVGAVLRTMVAVAIMDAGEAADYGITVHEHDPEAI